MRTNKGYSHVGLATHDFHKTVEFYRDVLGFPLVAVDTFKIKEGGTVKHFMFNVGRDQLLAFMAPDGVAVFSPEFDASLSKKIGVPSAAYHVSFEAGSMAGLEERRAYLIERGIDVSPLFPHAWAASIYFKDPVNGLTLEFCCWTRDLTEDDALRGETFEVPAEALSLMD